MKDLEEFKNNCQRVCDEIDGITRARSFSMSSGPTIHEQDFSADLRKVNTLMQTIKTSEESMKNYWTKPTLVAEKCFGFPNLWNETEWDEYVKDIVENTLERQTNPPKDEPKATAAESDKRVTFKKKIDVRKVITRPVERKKEQVTPTVTSNKFKPKPTAVSFGKLNPEWTCEDSDQSLFPRRTLKAEKAMSVKSENEVVQQPSETHTIPSAPESASDNIFQNLTTQLLPVCAIKSEIKCRTQKIYEIDVTPADEMAINNNKGAGDSSNSNNNNRLYEYTFNCGKNGKLITPKTNENLIEPPTTADSTASKIENDELVMVTPTPASDVQLTKAETTFVDIVPTRESSHVDDDDNDYSSAFSEERQSNDINIGCPSEQDNVDLSNKEGLTVNDDGLPPTQRPDLTCPSLDSSISVTDNDKVQAILTIDRELINRHHQQMPQADRKKVKRRERSMNIAHRLAVPNPTEARFDEEMTMIYQMIDDIFGVPTQTQPQSPENQVTMPTHVTNKSLPEKVHTSSDHHQPQRHYHNAPPATSNHVIEMARNIHKLNVNLIVPPERGQQKVQNEEKQFENHQRHKQQLAQKVHHEEINREKFLLGEPHTNAEIVAVDRPHMMEDRSTQLSYHCQDQCQQTECVGPSSRGCECFVCKRQPCLSVCMSSGYGYAESCSPQGKMWHKTMRSIHATAERSMGQEYRAESCSSKYANDVRIQEAARRFINSLNKRTPLKKNSARYMESDLISLDSRSPSFQGGCDRSHSVVMNAESKFRISLLNKFSTSGDQTPVTLSNISDSTFTPTTLSTASKDFISTGSSASKTSRSNGTEGQTISNETME